VRSLYSSVYYPERDIVYSSGVRWLQDQKKFDILRRQHHLRVARQLGTPGGLHGACSRPQSL
jgi:hypothetical protein